MKTDEVAARIVKDIGAVMERIQQRVLERVLAAIGDVMEGLELDPIPVRALAIPRKPGPVPKRLPPVTGPKQLPPPAQPLVGPSGRKVSLLCKHGHRKEGDNLWISPEGHRVCRQCQRNSSARHEKAKRERERVAP